MNSAFECRWLQGAVLQGTASGQNADKPWIAGRYEILETLGSGGMAVVYRARDVSTGEEVALKLATTPSSDVRSKEMFEREYHTLNQLAHPRVVRAFDYGLADGVPYYTLELLDGGDLRSQAPMPWKAACAMAYDVCSALSLIHSRRLVHRDLTPRNVRCTTDGTAKLIDFGLLNPFGAVARVAGTPPYLAPESLNSMSLDGRSDLFSLGTTLYQALTGHVAFPATRFDQLRELWLTTPTPPSRLVSEVPEALDELVLGLMRIDAEARPRGVAEVMDRLRPLLPTAPAQDLSCARAHLIAPQLVGRTGEVARVREQLAQSVRRRGGGFVVVGPRGLGRTRMLDVFALQAKLLGALTARVDAAEAAHGPFGVVDALIHQLHRAAPLPSMSAAKADPYCWQLLFGAGAEVTEEPSLKGVGSGRDARARAQEALVGWFERMGRRHVVAIMVDDIEQSDEPSAAVLAALSLEARQHRIAYAVTAADGAMAAPTQALSVLGERAQELRLGPLTREQTAELLTGVFGDVPHLPRLANQLHELSGGRPRDCMAIAQHLVNQGTVSYEGGTWHLPERRDGTWLPPSLEDALNAALEGLTTEAGTVARVLALCAQKRLSRQALAEVGQLSTAGVDQGVSELQSLQLIAGDVDGYTLTHTEAAEQLLAGLPAEVATALHDRLAAFYQSTEAFMLVSIHHRLQGNHPEEAFAEVLGRAQSIDQRVEFAAEVVSHVGVDAGARTLQLALAWASARGRSDRDLLPLWEMLSDLACKGAGLELYHEVCKPWLARLTCDTGLDDWLAMSDVADGGQRLQQALVSASQRHEAEPGAGLALRDALRALSHFVGISIMVGARSQDQALLQTLPGLLEPFAPLSPMLAFMYRNACTAVIAGLGRRQEAYERYRGTSFEAFEAEQPALIPRLQVAGYLARSHFLAALGVAINEPEVELFDASQKITSEYTSKIVALHRGDFAAAEAHGRAAERLALQHHSAPMFVTLNEELEAHALSRDLPGLKAVRRRIATTARVHAGWVGVRHLADAYYHQLCGEPDAALTAAERALATPKVGGALVRTVVPAAAVRVEALIELGRADHALELGLANLAVCEQEQRHHFARQIALAVALAEAKRGDFEQGRRRVLAVQQAQQQLGVQGLLAGRSAEYLARIAVWAGDEQGFEAASGQAAEHYRVGESSVFGALYERLLDEANAGGIGTARAHSRRHDDVGREAEALVSTTMLSCDDAASRGRAALDLLCDTDSERKGCLFLLTEAGFERVASSGDDLDVEALGRLAQERLDVEQELDVCTMTQAQSSTTRDASDVHIDYRDAGGQAYFAVPLVAWHRRVLSVVGVAVLAARGAELDGQVAGVARIVAKHLIESGDYAPVPVG